MFLPFISTAPLNPAFFAQRSVGKRLVIRLFTAVRHVQAVNDILTIEVVAQTNADGEMVKQGEADILIFAAGKRMIYFLFA